MGLNYSTDQFGRVIESTRPFPVRDVGVGTEREAVSAETITFVTGAAGFTGIVAPDKKPIANLRGDKVGSYWRQEKNLVLRAGPRNDGTVARITGVVETATMATVTIFDAQYNLEQLFEETAATRHHVIVITDASGDSLYGWVGAVAATGNSYVLNVHNAPTGGAQSWVGTLANFTFTNEGDAIFEAYSYESSFAWVTGTILTREVAYQEGGTEVEMLDAMANGDFAIDYFNGRILYKKATTGTTDTCNYSVLKSYVTLDSDIEIGAVELKDATTTARAIFNAANTGRAATDTVVLAQIIDETGAVVGGGTGPTAVQAHGFDVAGADVYATILTTVAAATHIAISVEGANPAEVSFNGGTTNHIRLPANSAIVLDDVLIAATTAIQARNYTAGSNYANLDIVVW